MKKVHKGYSSRQALGQRWVFLYTYPSSDAVFASMTACKNFCRYSKQLGKFVVEQTNERNVQSEQESKRNEQTHDAK